MDEPAPDEPTATTADEINLQLVAIDGARLEQQPAERDGRDGGHPGTWTPAGATRTTRPLGHERRHGHARDGVDGGAEDGARRRLAGALEWHGVGRRCRLTTQPWREGKDRWLTNRKNDPEHPIADRPGIVRDRSHRLRIQSPSQKPEEPGWSNAEVRREVRRESRRERLMLEYPPPPCPVDDTPYTACCGHDGPCSRRQ